MTNPRKGKHLGKFWYTDEEGEVLESEGNLRLKLTVLRRILKREDVIL